MKTTKTIREFTVPENFDESTQNFHTKEQAHNKLTNRSKKPLITQSKLFLEVASVIGKVRALEEITKAYSSYADNICVGKVFEWDENLLNAFVWMDTVQGHKFWGDINYLIEENNIMEK